MPDLEDFRRWFHELNFTAIKTSMHQIISSRKQVYIHHPLGFLLVEIIRINKSVLRLHFWKRDLINTGSAITPYHDHIWRLSSCVLHGSIENCILDVKNDANGDYILSEVQQSHSVDRVPSAGNKVSFDISSRERVRKGEFYNLPPRVFHFSKMIGDSNALTLVLSEPEIVGNPRTLMPIGVSGHAPMRKKLKRSDNVDQEILSLLEA